MAAGPSFLSAQLPARLLTPGSPSPRPGGPMWGQSTVDGSRQRPCSCPKDGRELPNPPRTDHHSQPAVLGMEWLDGRSMGCHKGPDTGLGQPLSCESPPTPAPDPMGTPPGAAPPPSAYEPLEQVPFPDACTSHRLSATSAVTGGPPQGARASSASSTTVQRAQGRAVFFGTEGV